MDTYVAPSKRSLRSRLARIFKLNPSPSGFNETPAPKHIRPQSPQPTPLIRLSNHRQASREPRRKGMHDSNLDAQLGERTDLTALLHGLTHRDSVDSSDHRPGIVYEPPEEQKPGDEMIASLSSELWGIVARHLAPRDAANLALSSRTLHRLLGSQHWTALGDAENRGARLEVLMAMDAAVPDQLFCFPCATFHRRIFRGQEKLQGPGALNPLFTCPNALSYVFRPPRLRLTPRRQLPYTFLQLALRAEKYGMGYGVAVDSLARRWSEGPWSHATRYVVHKGHLLLRVASLCLVPTGGAVVPSVQRSLLLSRGDYSPCFSVCQHWTNSDLIQLCQCALSHIPQAPEFEGPRAKLKGALPMGVGPTGRKSGSAMGMVRLCGKCQPMRRCRECPTEYMIELRLVPRDEAGGFRRAIALTRWSDLGDEMSPYRGEWAACTGRAGDGAVGDVKGVVAATYDSLAVMGKRAISGVFEGLTTAEQVPGQRILPLSIRRIREPEEVGKEDGGGDDDW